MRLSLFQRGASVEEVNSSAAGDFRAERLADFIYEAAMLKHTPRSGFAFLGSGHESVAGHSFGAAAAGYVLAHMAGIDPARVVLLCLFHDLHEAATGDFNYVNHRYDACDAEQALRDACDGTGLEREVMELWREFSAKGTPEALLARDADQIDMIAALRRELARGNPFAAKWLKTATQRLKTEAGKKLCAAVMRTDPNHWWHEQVDESWWVDRGQ